MRIARLRFQQPVIAKQLLSWFFLIIPVSIITGSLVAFFLWLLQVVTVFRWNNSWLLFLLPVAGIIITLLYKYFGKNSEAGNNLIMEEIHKPGGGIPVRMAPLVLFTTIITHLFGGSAGREGTAVQMGGSISALFAKWYRLPQEQKRILLMCGMSAGFGAVFGTPVAGAIFAMEVLAIGRIKYDALLPCLFAAIVADITCSAWGIQHTHYNIANLPASLPEFKWLPASFNLLLLLKVMAGGVAFGLAGYLFAELSHRLKLAAKKYISNPWLIPVTGGLLVIGISYLLGTFDYLGLGVVNPAGGVSIVSSFNAGGAHTWSWLWKLLLTAITLSTGFKGGEVTPLFFIGAALGNTLAMAFGAPADLFAALGFLAVFAAATNTPIACTLMGAELFGTDHILLFALACFTAYYFSGHKGIYTAQQLSVSKLYTREEDKAEE